MTAEEPIRPATDEEIAEYLVLHRKKGGGYWNCDLDANVTVRQFIARIEADAATIRELEVQRADYKAGFEAREVGAPWDKDQSVEWLDGWEKYDALETVDALRAQNAAQAEEIEKLKERRWREWRVCSLHPEVNGATMWGCPDCLAELRARCERYEGLILRDSQLCRQNIRVTGEGCICPMCTEARAILASRKEGESK